MYIYIWHEVYSLGICAIHLYTCTYFILTAPSSPPTSFQVNVLSTTAIFFSWEPPPPEHHNGIIRRYLIVLESQDFFGKIRVFTTETSITVNNLHPYTVYNCTVAAETILIGVETDIQSNQTFESGWLNLNHNHISF